MNKVQIRAGQRNPEKYKKREIKKSYKKGLDKQVEKATMNRKRLLGYCTTEKNPGFSFKTTTQKLNSN